MEDFPVIKPYNRTYNWEKQITKKVRPVFQVYTNSTFYLFEYEFVETNNYNSLNLLQSKAYQFRDRVISLQEVFEIADPPSHELLNKRVRLVGDARLGHFLLLT